MVKKKKLVTLFSILLFKEIYIYIYIYIYILRISLNIYTNILREWERERKKEREGGRWKETETEKPLHVHLYYIQTYFFSLSLFKLCKNYILNTQLLALFFLLLWPYKINILLPQTTLLIFKTFNNV